MKQISDTFFVAEQLSLSQIPDLAQAGIRHIICNRPDGEAEEQIESAALKTTAEQAGMTFHYLPTAPGQFDPKLIAEFTSLATTLKGKSLAYCRTGTRSLPCCR